MLKFSQSLVENAICYRHGKPQYLEGSENSDIPGSAMTISSGRPFGDHLSTEKNCSPVLDKSFGPRDDVIEESKDLYRGNPQ